MATKIIGGKVKRLTDTGLEKMRVSYVVAAPGPDNLPQLAFINGFIYLRRKPAEQPNMPPMFEGPINAGWVNMKHTYPEHTEGLSFVGVLVANLDKPWEGHIDWVVATDTPIRNREVS